MSMAPGWYPDPFSGGYVRWWDGRAWSSATQVAQRSDAAPVPAPAPPPPPYQGTPEQPAPPWAGYQAYPPRPDAPAFPLSTWGSRFLARLIDYLILAVVLVPLYLAVLWPAITDFFDQLPRDPSQPLDPQVVVQFETRVIGQALLLGLIAAFVQMAYEVPQLVASGRTIGKRVVGQRIRPLAEDRTLTWTEATARTGLMVGGTVLAGGLFLLLDDLWPLWDKPWQQALHDKAAKTVVVPN
jgi:uncharacterized RDD family membrane protein YckC